MRTKEEKSSFVALGLFSLFLLFSCGGGGGGTGGGSATQVGPPAGQPSEPPSGGENSMVSLSVSPTSQSVNVGNTFPVDVKLNTNNHAATAVSAYIGLPTDLLEVDSIITANSSFTVQAENIVENNLIKITRGERNPGVNNLNAHIATVYFKAKAQGTAQVVFQLSNAGAGPSRVIKNDGLGTDILARAIGGSYIIKP